MKRLLSFILILTIVCAAVLGMSASAVRAGDLNEDGEINNKDVVVLFRVVSSGDEIDISVADLNSDGFVDNKDVVTLFRMVSNGEIIIEEPVEYATEFTKKFNPSICDQLGISVPEDYEPIE